MASVADIANNGVEKKDKDPIVSLFQTLESKKNEFKSILPKSIDIDVFLGVCKTAALVNPDLALADRRTLFTACMECAKDGLLPDSKEAVLNIYSTKINQNGKDVWIKKVQYLPMVAGLIKKLWDSGQVTYIDAAVVYEKDKFKYIRGDSSSLEHEQTMEDDPGKIICAYMVVKLKNGETKREVMPRRDIEKVRLCSKTPDGAWLKWYDQFAIKSVIKRAYKQLPKTKELEVFFDEDNKKEFDIKADYSVINENESTNRSTGVIENKQESLKLTYAEVKDLLIKASSKEELNHAAKLIDGVDINDELDDFYKNRLVELN